MRLPERLARALTRKLDESGPKRMAYVNQNTQHAIVDRCMPTSAFMQLHHPLGKSQLPKTERTAATNTTLPTCLNGVPNAIAHALAATLQKCCMLSWWPSEATNHTAKVDILHVTWAALATTSTNVNEDNLGSNEHCSS